MAATAPARERLLTIGTVCRRLKPEFPDISISKIRYLEDQGLLTPKRTQGGYRLFGEDDVERLETILRLQRDEFLPLRVIREELASGKEPRRRRAALGEAEEGFVLEELCERAGIEPSRARELEEFGLLEPLVEGGQRVYSETDLDVAVACEIRLRVHALSTLDERDAGALRDRTASPARVSDGRRPRVGTARGGCRAGAACAEPRTPPRRPRGLADAPRSRAGAVQATAHA